MVRAIGLLMLAAVAATLIGPATSSAAAPPSASNIEANPEPDPPPRFLPLPQDIADSSDEQLFGELTEKLMSGAAVEASSTLTALDSTLGKLREPNALRGLVQFYRAGALMHLDRLGEATDAIEESIRLLPDYSGPLITAAMIHAYSNRSGIAADYLIRASQVDPVSVRMIDDYEVNNVIQRLRNSHDRRRIEALSERLITIGWVGTSLRTRSSLAKDVIKRRVDSGDLDGARQLVPKLLVPDDVVELLAQKAYQVIWPDIERWTGSRLEKLWPIYLGEARARWSASKDAESARDYIKALELAGHDQTIIREFVPRFEKPDANADYDLLYVANAVADALGRQRRWADADKLFEAAQKVWPLGKDANALNIIANRAKFELYQGKLTSALAHMDRAITEAGKWGAQINSDAFATMHQFRACILAELGRFREASIAAAIAAPGQNAYRMAYMYLCMGNEAAAKKTLLDAFEHSDNRHLALAFMQEQRIDWVPGAYADRLRARFARLKADLELLQAVSRHGRILPYRIGEAAPAEDITLAK